MPTREELYRSIYTDEVIYVPVYEEMLGTPSLELTRGCSWAKCTFCDFCRDKFEAFSVDHVAKCAQVMAELRPDSPRMFLLGDNSFCLSTDRLLATFDAIKAAMPNVSQFALYSRVDDIMRKTDEELLRLRKNGLHTLHLGLESGSDIILARCNKGVTSADMVRELQRLDRLGIFYCATVIMGLGGKELSDEHALATARMLNQVNCVEIRPFKLHLYEGTPLYDQARAGEFEQITPFEVLLEERLMIEHLDVSRCQYIDSTVLDSFTLLATLPDEKEKLLAAIDQLVGMVVAQSLRAAEAAEASQTTEAGA